MSLNTRNPPTFFGPFYSTILRGPYAVLCAVTVMSSADLLLLRIYFGMWPYVYMIYFCVCLVLLSVEGLFVNMHIFFYHYLTL